MQEDFQALINKVTLVKKSLAMTWQKRLWEEEGPWVVELCRRLGLAPGLPLYSCVIFFSSCSCVFFKALVFCFCHVYRGGV